jgi:hypothetical protein
MRYIADLSDLSGVARCGTVLAQIGALAHQTA